MFYRIQRMRVQLDCGTEMVTKQSHKDECDIHRILRQYQRTGIITHVTQARPSYMDLPSELDFQTAQNLIIQAEATFQALPSAVRDRFANDPARFLAAFSDPSQESYLRETGFLKPLQADGVIPATAPAGAPDKPSGGVP